MNNKIDQFIPGDRVTYIPTHAYGDIKHPDCETGTVSSIGKSFVFVRYHLGDTAAATRPEDLVNMEKR